MPFKVVPGVGTSDIVMKLCDFTTDSTCPNFDHGDPPVFLNPTTFSPLTGATEVKLSTGMLVASSNRVGTYYAYLAGDGSGGKENGQPNNPWVLRTDVRMEDAAGTTCIDTANSFVHMESSIQMGKQGGFDCPVTSDNRNAGYVEVQVVSGTTQLQGALVRVGQLRKINSYAKNYEESITDSPSLSNERQTDLHGIVEFNDVGNYLNLGPIDTAPNLFADWAPQTVSATCPGGTIGDVNTITKPITSTRLQIDLGPTGGC